MLMRSLLGKKSLIILLLIFLFLLPLGSSSYFISVLIFMGIYSIVGLGLCLLIGYAGQLSLGHNAFFGLGAYTSAILSFRYGVSPWLGIVIGMLLTGSIAYGLGKPVLRLKGHMLVVVTTAIGIIFWGLFGEMDFITGGYEGFSRIPRFSIAGISLSGDLSYYYLVLIILIAVFLVSSNIAKSKIGAAFKSLDVAGGGSEIAAESLGINIPRIKTQVFVISAIYTSLAGSLYVHYMTHIDPTPFNLWTAFIFVIIVVIGGGKNLWGPILGSVFYFGLREVISVIMPLSLTGAQAGYESVIFALLFIVVLLAFPKGLIQIPEMLWKRLEPTGREILSAHAGEKYM